MYVRNEKLIATATYYFSAVSFVLVHSTHSPQGSFQEDGKSVTAGEHRFLNVNKSLFEVVVKYCKASYLQLSLCCCCKPFRWLYYRKTPRNITIHDPIPCGECQRYVLNLNILAVSALLNLTLPTPFTNALVAQKKSHMKEEDKQHKRKLQYFLLNVHSTHEMHVFPKK